MNINISRCVSVLVCMKCISGGLGAYLNKGSKILNQMLKVCVSAYDSVSFAMKHGPIFRG